MLKFLKYIFYGFVLFVVSIAWAVYSFVSSAQDSALRSVVPKHIEIEKIVSIKKGRSYTAVMNSFLVVKPWEFCGGAIYKITQETLVHIAHDGTSFLDQDLYGRGITTKDTVPSLFPWQKTPIASDMKLSLGMTCLLNEDHDMISEFLSASQNGGSFFTTRDNVELWLVPDMGLLFYVFSG